MRFLSKTYLLSLLFFGLIMSSCGGDDDDPVVPPTPVNEEELITTMQVTFTPVSGTPVRTFNFTDLDGEGGNSPVITTEPLDSGTTYAVKITLLNEQENPAENITTEVKDEGDEHQFFLRYQSSDASNIQFSYTDMDVNGQPIGIESTAMTAGSGNGTLTITLRHEPIKSAAGVVGGDITNAGGETDIEVVFPVTVQ